MSSQRSSSVNSATDNTSSHVSSGSDVAEPTSNNESMPNCDEINTSSLPRPEDSQEVVEAEALNEPHVIADDAHSITVPEIAITPSSPVLTSRDIKMKENCRRRSVTGVEEADCKSVDPVVLSKEPALETKGASATVKSTIKDRFALALKKKFNSLSLGRNKRSTGDVIRKDKEVIIQSERSKKSSSDILVASFQLGLAYAVGKLTSKPERDVLLNDFTLTDEIYFPRHGSTVTPSHKLNNFSMVDYSPIAFKFFRDIFQISPSDFMTSLGVYPLVQISNPGASGSMFFLSEDDQFIVKSVDKREAVFLQQLLPGYYMNIHQNPLTYLPKFFGMYAFKGIGRALRVVVMNNLLPSKLVFHEKYDLKGSTYKRRASSKERLKSLPTLKDLDFVLCHPMGLVLSAEGRKILMEVLERDVRVLQSFKIMDYSLLLSIHNLTQYRMSVLGEERYQQLSGRSSQKPELDQKTYESYIAKGVPAKNRRGEDLILFIGIIDILQDYRLAKKTEHRFKSLVHDGDAISVHNPKFYAKRFITFCKYVFQDESEEAKPYPHLNSLQTIAGSYVDEYLASTSHNTSLSHRESVVNGPQVVQEESVEVWSETPCVHVEFNKSVESSTSRVEEDEV